VIEPTIPAGQAGRRSGRIGSTASAISRRAERAARARSPRGELAAALLHRVSQPRQLLRVQRVLGDGLGRLDRDDSVRKECLDHVRARLDMGSTLGAWRRAGKCVEPGAG
jgi:hypothetical protein